MKFLVFETLKYLDCFGTKFNFYTERNRKLYTPLGGILSLLSFFSGIMIFIHINFDNFSHNIPISTTSTGTESYKNIKFNEEKIWIPWRIRDYNSKSINHSGIFYPIIYYYKGIRNYSKEEFKLTYNVINYTLCNETSMMNNSDLYLIDIELDQLYCIDMGDLDMGGNWIINFINYVEFDLYICKNGIDYNENNENCTSFEKIIEFANNDNSFEFEIYYPVVHYQPMNKSTPIFVRYYNYFYHLSRFSNKIDRLYLQKYILMDDKGWIFKSEKNYTYWGYLTINGDSYTYGDTKDLMNEGSSSRLYSFNIYLTSDVVYYNRSYKKLFLIVADGLPIVNIVFIIFRLIAKIFKISSGNKKLTELLFENLQESPIIKNNEKFHVLKINKRKSEKKLILHKKNYNDNSHINKNYINKIIPSSIINLNDITSSYLSPQLELKNKKLLHDKNKRKNKIVKNFNSQIIKNKKILNSSIKNNFNFNCSGIGVNSNNININIHNNIGDNSSSKINDLSSSAIVQLNKPKLKKKFIEENKPKKPNMNNNLLKTKIESHYIKRKLFPYKYYLCSIFIKNIDITKKSIFFTKKFVAVYNFICQLLDISSYLILQKEFQIMKNTIMIGKYRDIFENMQKINVNDHSFNTDMKECLASQKFSILGRIKQLKI